MPADSPQKRPGPSITTSSGTKDGKRGRSDGTDVIRKDNAKGNRNTTNYPHSESRNTKSGRGRPQEGQDKRGYSYNQPMAGAPTEDGNRMVKDGKTTRTVRKSDR